MLIIFISELVELWKNLQENILPRDLEHIESVSDFLHAYTPGIQQMLFEDARETEHNAICARFNFVTEDNDV